MPKNKESRKLSVPENRSVTRIVTHKTLDLKPLRETRDAWDLLQSLGLPDEDLGSYTGIIPMSRC